MSEGSTRIAVLVGSLRKASVNRELAELAVERAGEGVTLSVVGGLENLPFYNEDIDLPDSQPAAVSAVRGEVDAADAVLLVTPEYNGTIPAVLKNAIDWLSRPYGAGALSGKPVGVIGAALGQYAGTWSRQDTRKAVGIAGGRVVEEVEIGVGTGALTEAGVRTPEIGEQISEAIATLAGATLVQA